MTKEASGTPRDKISHFFILSEEGDSLFEWTPNGTRNTVFSADLIACRENAFETAFYHQEIKNSHVVSWKNNSLTFIVVTGPQIQYQIAESFLTAAAETFNKTFSAILNARLVMGGGDLFKGFATKVPELFDATLKEKVKKIKAHCRVCGKFYPVYVKKSLIEDAEEYPVALVYLHQGHGLIIYIDANYKVRGTEQVDITA